MAIVLLLIGTNLRAGGGGRGARFKKHVVEFTEVHSYVIYNCIYIYIYKIGRYIVMLINCGLLPSDRETGQKIV